MTTFVDNSAVPAPKERESLGELAALFLRLGLTAFGGPLAHVALMRKECVERRGWFTQTEFLDLFGAVNLIPGPSSTQLAMHIGYRRHGVLGLVAAGSAFISPAMLLVLALAAAYRSFGHLPASRDLLRGVAPVVVAIVVQALASFAPVALKSRVGMVAAAIVLCASLRGVSPGVLIACAGVLGALAALRVVPTGNEPPVEQGRDNSQPPAKRNALIWLGAPVVGAGGKVMSLFLAFLKIGCLVYGSGYVLLAYLHSDLVVQRHWFIDVQLLDAVAVGQVTPGPVFTTATFLGYQAAGVAGGLAATLGIFGPSFALVWLVGATLGRYQKVPRLRAFLAVVNAASLGLMAAVTLQLAGAAAWPAGRPLFGPLLVGLTATFLVLRTRLNPAWLLVAGALCGLVWGGAWQ